jgi:hypothetical protein
MALEFQSLYSIIEDFLYTIRGSVISASESISDWQVEYWIHLYRALVLKQDLDKGKIPNPDYIQEIKALHLSPVQNSELSNIYTNKYVLRTDLQIPTTVDLNFEPGIMYIGSVDGTELQMVPQGRTTWQKYKYYTNKEPLVYLKNRYLYVINGDTINYLDVRGVFEIPTEVSNFINPITGISSYDINIDKYPIPSDKLTIIKQMILEREFNIIRQSPSDNQNNSINDLVYAKQNQ